MPKDHSLSKDQKDPTDPAYIGPGEWNLIHRTAFHVESDGDVVFFMELMEKERMEFPCDVCRKHINEYMTNNPFNEYINVRLDGKRIGLFIWTWKFHNAVNKRLGKPIVNWDTAYSMYSSTECSETCKVLAK